MEHIKYNTKLDINYLKKNDNVIVAFSGGRDSVFLIDNLLRLRDLIGFNLYALHVNHSIRDEESIRDMKFCESYAREHKIKFFKKTVDAKKYSKSHSISLEEAARILRYNVFKNIYHKYNGTNNKTYIAIAHHKNDQAETVLHNLFRGSGIKGMAGMDRTNKYLIRPMLDISRDEINEYIENNQLKFVEDSTNNDINYTRNYIRNEIMPMITNVNSLAIDHISEFAKQARELTEFISILTDKLIKDIIISPENIQSEIRLINNINKIKVVDNKSFNNISKFIKGEVVRELIKDFTPHLKDITKENINDIIVLSSKDKGGHLDLPYNIIVEKKKKYLIFMVTKENISMSRRKKK